MPIENRKATAITNADASPRVLSPTTLSNGNKREHVGVITVLAADSVASVLRFSRVRSNDRVSKVYQYNAALGGSAAMDVGLYRTAADGGAVVDADFFASAVSLVSAVNGTEIQHESGVFTLANADKPIWQALGLAADPGLMYDIAGTITAVAASPGAVVLKVETVNQS